MRSDSRVRVEPHHFRLEVALMWRMLKLSGSGMFQVFIGMASWIGLVYTMSTFGSEAVAGAVQAIASAATRTEQGVLQSRRNVEQLARLAEELTVKLSRFKLAS